MRVGLLLPILLAAAPIAGTRSTSFFTETEHRVDVFVSEGAEPGRTVLVLGGIHGDESGGYKAAEQLLNVPLRRGKLIVIPQVNRRAIVANERGVEGDMNRMFDLSSAPDGPNGDVVQVVKSYMREADLLLNLHDGWGYYDPVYRDEARNPMRYGQSVIADCREFYSAKYGSIVNVQEQAETVLRAINARISESGEKFHFSNHETASVETSHPEQRKSATYYSMTHCGIPAFGIEASKNLASDADRVRYHLMIIDEFLRLYGLESREAALEAQPPQLGFGRAGPVRTSEPAGGFPAAVQRVAIAFDLNGMAGLLAPRSRIEVVRGDRFMIAEDDSIRANIVGYVAPKGPNEGRDNGCAVDTGKELIARYSMDGKGDRYRIRLFAGGVELEAATLEIVSPVLKSISLHVGDRARSLRSGESIEIAPGERIMVTGIETNLTDESTLKVNFVGYRGRGDGEDRGMEIDASDLIPAYSTDGTGSVYAVRVTRFGRRIGEAYVRLRKEGV